MEQREAERHLIMQQYPGFYRITTVVVLICIGILIGWILFADKDGYGMNLWTEFVGVGFTFLVLDWWGKQQDKREQKEQRLKQLREDLIYDVAKGENRKAISAIKSLDRHGWLRDGSLAQANLQHAKLENAPIRYGNLNNANLEYADLTGSLGK